MTTLLQINASLFSNNGQSSRLSEQFVGGWRAANPQGKVVVRDLAAAPVPHLDAQRFGALLAKPEERSAQQQAVVDFSDQLIDELRHADVIALGLPMYNFGVPSTLKAYFDHVARAGVTFKYTETGPVGLLNGKKAYVFAARGGQYAGTALDTQTGYVRDFLRFIGISDVEFVYAEGLNMGEESKRSALDAASASIRQLTAPLRAAA
ncbi:FMN-dependent NADH-azoreductase [Noviherbaspirillum autotrophicum]|uniref:FMN dependent NADH:quinone oxidoreductase n=1 Tax=Noviherbaspirillum autotrophicum TaxID=709839 RepID=A0A0C1YLX5_9BURK|nr:NAD(P)H-dependent oxidoreductase [Noviherbaspirillum autotrophicum]KIF81497.1 FMN-dependent NADH-azoreductase [Noviherbaspirillum autotrophicum]